MVNKSVLLKLDLVIDFFGEYKSGARYESLAEKIGHLVFCLI